MKGAARPYAEALFASVGAGGAAAASEMAGALAGELEGVVTALQQQPEARAVLTHPAVAPAAAQAALAGLTTGRSPLVANLLRLLFAKRRFGLLPDIATALRARVDEASGRVRGRLQTARALEDAQREAIVRSLGRRLGRTVEMTPEVRPELIGGARVVLGDRVLDASVAGRLAALRQQLARRR